MRIRIYSDLHMEFAPFAPPAAACDLVVLAGDIHINRNGVKWAVEAFPSTPVVYVCGNHEYYGRAIPKLTNDLKDLVAGTNIHVLECEAIVVAGLRILGTTFWTDFELHGDAGRSMRRAQEGLTDFRRIRLSPRFRRLSPGDTRTFHHRSRGWLAEQFAIERSAPTIVVTHHAPSARSLPGPLATDDLSPAYASNCDELVRQSGAHLWIHGHVHSRSDYVLGQTRVVCNPRGYGDEPVPDFDPGFIVDLAPAHERMA